MFGLNPSKTNLKKYHHSDEKIYVPKFIPNLEELESIKEDSTQSFVDVNLNLRIVQKIVESEIETIRYASEYDDTGTPKLANSLKLSY